MKKLLWVFFLNALFIPFAANAAVINFECTVNNAGAKYDEYVKKSNSASQTAADAGQKSSWWKFWGDDKQSYKLIFSVEGDTNEVLYPMMTTVDVLPALITFKEYTSVPCEGGAQCDVLSDMYEIDLQNGNLNGEQYAVDGSYEPLFKKGDKMWDVKGKCEKTL